MEEKSNKIKTEVSIFYLEKLENFIRKRTFKFYGINRQRVKY